MQVEVRRQPHNRVTVASAGPQGPRGPVGGSNGTGSSVVNVLEFGAVGNGATDDTEAIQDAIDAAGVNTPVFFPAGTYLISAPLVPKRGQVLEGVYSTKYEPGPWPFTGGTIIRANPATFTGSAVVVSAPTSYGVTLSRLALVGPGRDEMSTVHGVYFGPYADSSGERAWTIDGCLINGCSGAGISGHMWVTDIRNSHIANCGFGIMVEDDDSMRDVRITTSQVYFNRHGGLVMKGSAGSSGQVVIMGSRFERSGNTYGDPADPLEADAPGIALRRCHAVQLLGCSTDANTGSGLLIEGDPDDDNGDGSYYTYNIAVLGCVLSKDGGGAQTDGITIPPGDEGAGLTISADGFSGIHIRQADYIDLTGSQVTYGQHDDSGGGGPVSPQYGVTLDNCRAVVLRMTRISVLPGANTVREVGSVFRTALDMPHQGIFSVPVAGDATFLPDFGGIGSVAYQSDIGSLVVRNFSGNWMRSAWWVDGGYAQMPYQVRIRGDNTDYKTLIFESEDDVARWTMSQTSDGIGANFIVNRNDATGDYQSTPLTLRSSDGKVILRHTLIEPQANGLAMALYRADAETGAYIEWQRETGGALGGVDSAGKAWGPDATWQGHYIPLGQLQAVVAASSDFADFQSRVSAL